MRAPRTIWFAIGTIAASTLFACRPERCSCAFDSTLEAAIAACPPDPSFPSPDLGTTSPSPDLAKPPQLDDGGAPIDPPQDLGGADLSAAAAAADMGPPSSCLTIQRVVLADAPLRSGRSPLSLVLDTLALDETLTAIPERSPFSNATVYRVVQRGNQATCGYVEDNALVPTDKARTVKRTIDPATDSAACISGR